MYPAELGEAAAVERSIQHAIDDAKASAKNKRARSHSCGHRPIIANTDEKTEKYPGDNSEKAKNRHILLPSVNVVAAEPLHRALPRGPQHEHSHADKREEQHAAEGNGEFKQLGCGDEVEHGSPHGLHQPCQHAAVSSEEQAGADGYAVKKHLRLRVVWQGLLT